MKLSRRSLRSPPRKRSWNYSKILHFFFLPNPSAQWKEIRTEDCMLKIHLQSIRVSTAASQQRPWYVFILILLTRAKPHSYLPSSPILTDNTDHYYISEKDLIRNIVLLLLLSGHIWEERESAGNVVPDGQVISNEDGGCLFGRVVLVCLNVLLSACLESTLACFCVKSQLPRALSAPADNLGIPTTTQTPLSLPKKCEVCELWTSFKRVRKMNY